MTQTASDLANAQTAPLVPVPANAGHPYLSRITPFEEGTHEAEAMETWLAASASPEPFALELVGTSDAQGFALRASNEEQRVLLVKQFEAQYPQAEITGLSPEADPLRLRPGEHALVADFALTRPSWLPLKLFPGKTLAQPGADPLHGIFAAMEPLAPGECLVVQLALARAPDSWIQPDIRKAVEHPLQQERDAAARRPSSGRAAASSDLVEAAKIGFGMLALVVSLLGYRLYRAQALLPLCLLLLATAAVCLGALVWWWKRQVRPPVYEMELVREKLSRQAFYTQLRVIALGRTSTSPIARLESHLARMEVAYRQLAQAHANSLAIKRLTHVRAEDRQQAAELVRPDAAFPWRRPLWRALHGGAYGPDIWCVLELSGPFHLPQELADLPLVRRLAVKRLPASPEIMRQVAEAGGPLPPVRLGTSTHRGRSVPVLLPFDAFSAHLFLAGSSRTGKSSLMLDLLWALMQPVRDGTPQPGIFAIDPHGDLARDALSLVAHLAPERARDVLFLDFTDRDFVVGLNPLDASMGLSRDQAIANLISSFERVWKETWGPRMAFFLRNVCLLLYTLNERLVREGRASEQYTLLDINPLLQYQDYALAVLHQLDQSEPWHQEMLAWWQHTYFTLPKNSSFRNEVILPILSKMAVFADNQQLRRIVGQPVTTARLWEAVSSGKIIICALSSREMDDTSLNVIGSTLINLLRRTFREQEALPLTERRKVFVAIDEFQAFSGAALEHMLAEDAKFGCTAILATQFLKQLNTFRDGLLDTVLSNCQHLFAFRVSASDAKLLEGELQGKVSQKHIISQPRMHAYARLALPGYPLQVVSLQLDPPLSWQRTPALDARAEAIRKAQVCRMLPAAEADRIHHAHLSRFLDVSFFSQWIAEEVRRSAERRARREEAEDLQRQVEQQARESGAPSQQAAPTPPNPPAEATPPGCASATPPQEREKAAARPKEQQARKQGSAPPQQPQQRQQEPGKQKHNGRQGNRTRSRRMGRFRQFSKTPAGARPPGLDVPLPNEADNTRHAQRPLFTSPGGQSSSHSREGRERGERA